MTTARQEQVARITDRIEARMATRHQHVCGGCNKELPLKHLRVNFANPDKPWHAMRFHDLLCLIDFLEDEEEADGTGLVFSDPKWVNASLSAS